MPSAAGSLAPSPRSCLGCLMSAAASWRRPVRAEAWEAGVSESTLPSSPYLPLGEPHLPAGKPGGVGALEVLEPAPTRCLQVVDRGVKAPLLRPGGAFAGTVCVASGTEEPSGSDLHPGRTPSPAASSAGSRGGQHLQAGSSCPSS